MPEQIMNNLNERMEKAIASLRRELASIRAGKASAAVLDRLTVDYYGVATPINQVAGVSVPEPKMLVISPYEKTLLGDIERAIQASDLGLNPSNDGSVIRIVFPALTEERRKELAKLVGKESEGAKVAVRNVRRDAMDAMKKLEKASQITEDDLKGYSDDIQKATDKFVAEIDKVTKTKKERQLTAIESEELAKYRQLYLKNFKANMRNILDNTKVINEKGEDITPKKKGL